MTTDTQFDTHSGQAGTFDAGVQLVSDSLAAFQADLEARGIDDRVLVHVWSEFGRRAQENGSDGTDHGAAGTSLLIGTPRDRRDGRRVPGARRSSTSTATRSRTSTSARVYCSLLEQWFGHDAGRGDPGRQRFARTQLIA